MGASLFVGHRQTFGYDKGACCAQEAEHQIEICTATKDTLDRARSRAQDTNMRHSLEMEMSTSDQEPRIRPIVSGNEEEGAVSDSRPGDRSDESARQHPWLLIGRRFLRGIPFTPTTNR